MIRAYKPTSPGVRFRKTLVKDVDKIAPEKSLVSPLKGATGRSHGRISTRHRQMGVRKHYRTVDFKRDKIGIVATVFSVEHDPNRGPNIALVHYADGEKRYILAPQGLVRGQQIVSGPQAEPKVGNCLPVENIPLGKEIHNIELTPGKGGILVRGAGNSAQILAKEAGYVQVKLPSGEVKRILGRCYATIGVLGNDELRNARAGKAGILRHKGWRPAVRGVAMSDPKNDHPHAGSYSKTGIGMKAPKSPWGWKTLGVKSRKRSRTNYTIVKKRKGK